MGRRRTFQLEDDTTEAGFGSGSIATATTESVTSGVVSQKTPAPQVIHEGRNIVFFRPVDNINHLTLLGDAPRRCDFVSQIFMVVSLETERGSGTCHKISHVTIGPPLGAPKLAKLSNLNYDVLSSKLGIWTCDESGYHVNTTM